MTNGSDNPGRLGYTMLAAFCAQLDGETKRLVSESVSERSGVWLSRLSDEALLMEASRPAQSDWRGVSYCVIESPMTSTIKRLCEAAASFLPASRIDTVSGPLIPSDPASPVITTVTASCTPQADLYGVKQEITLQIIRFILQ